MGATHSQPEGRCFPICVPPCFKADVLVQPQAPLIAPQVATRRNGLDEDDDKQGPANSVRGLESQRQQNPVKPYRSLWNQTKVQQKLDERTNENYDQRMEREARERAGKKIRKRHSIRSFVAGSSGGDTWRRLRGQPVPMDVPNNVAQNGKCHQHTQPAAEEETPQTNNSMPDSGTESKEDQLRHVMGATANKGSCAGATEHSSSPPSHNPGPEESREQLTEEERRHFAATVEKMTAAWAHPHASDVPQHDDVPQYDDVPQHDQPNMSSENVPFTAANRNIQLECIDRNVFAIERLKGDPLCWYQVHVLCYDIRHFNVTTESHIRLNKSEVHISNGKQKDVFALLVPSTVPGHILHPSVQGSSNIKDDNIETLGELFEYLRTMSTTDVWKNVKDGPDSWKDIYFKDLAPFFEYTIGIFDGGRQLENRLWFLELMLKYGTQPPIEELTLWDEMMGGVHGIQDGLVTAREVASLWRGSRTRGINTLQEWIRAINGE